MTKPTRRDWILHAPFRLKAPWLSQEGGGPGLRLDQRRAQDITTQYCKL